MFQMTTFIAVDIVFHNKFPLFLELQNYDIFIKFQITNLKITIMIYGYIRVSTDRQEALARKRAEGVILGRPKGSKSKVKKLTGKETEIKNLLDKKISKSAIARILGVHRLTVAEFVKEI
jgi:hypothetical protein